MSERVDALIKVFGSAEKVLKYLGDDAEKILASSSLTSDEVYELKNLAHSAQASQRLSQHLANAFHLTVEQCDKVYNVDYEYDKFADTAITFLGLAGYPDASEPDELGVEICDEVQALLIMVLLRAPRIMTTIHHLNGLISHYYQSMLAKEKRDLEL